MTQNGDLVDQAQPRGRYLFNLLREPEIRASQAEIVEFLHEVVVRTAGPDAAPLGPDEASQVDEAKAGVNNAVRSIELLLKKIPHPVLRNDLLAAFNDALLYAYILGNHSTPTESIWKLHGSEYHRQLSSKARKARALLIEERQESLKAAILAVSKPGELTASYSYAELIRKSVLQHLDITSGTWPSKRTIERAIGAILKECGEKPRHSKRMGNRP